jgi:hypothetical protein
VTPEVSKLKVEVLYFDGCPTYESAVKVLERALSEEGLEVEVELVSVETDEEAERLRFPGSPTIRVDGEDLFPVPGRPSYAFGCRTYVTPEGLRGSPNSQMFRGALAKLRPRS